MPGLIRGVARTAVVAGTASAVAGRVHHRQQGKWAAQEQEQQAAYAEQAPPPAPEPQYAPPPAAPSTDDKLAQLQQLGSSGTPACSPTPSSKPRRARFFTPPDPAA